MTSAGTHLFPVNPFSKGILVTGLSLVHRKILKLVNVCTKGFSKIDERIKRHTLYLRLKA